MTDKFAEFRAWCERKGEAYVREAVATGRVMGSRAKFAANWLVGLERDSNERMRVEDRRTARSAKNAAWAAAIAAIVAAIAATISMVMVFLA